MKILLVGVFEKDWSTNVEMFKALVRLGHTVDTFSYREMATQASRIQFRSINSIIHKITNAMRLTRVFPRILKTLHYAVLGRNSMNRALLETARSKNYELVILCKVDTVSPEVISKISEFTKTWYFFMDSLEHGLKVDILSYAKACRYVSATFSDVALYFRSKTGRPNVYWITQGVDLEKFRVSPEACYQKTKEVVFVGAKTKSRQKIVQKIRESGIKLECYGKGWENQPIYNQKLRELYSSAKIVLNLCRGGGGFSVRVFQVMACSTFVLSDYCLDFESFFIRRKHIDWVESCDQWSEKIRYYLVNTDEADLIARNAQILVEANHGWDIVMSKIISKI